MLKRLTIIIILFLSFFGLLSLPALAAESLTEATFNVQEVLTLDDGKQNTAYFDHKEGPIVGFILAVLNYATGIIGSIAIILLIVAGFRFMFAGGNQQKLDEAKEMVKYAVIGLVVTFAAYIIVIFVQSLFIPNQ